MTKEEFYRRFWELVNEAHADVWISTHCALHVVGPNWALILDDDLKSTSLEGK